MAIKVLAFGQLAEITGKTFTMDSADTESLKIQLAQQFPQLTDRKFAIAVNRKTISGNTILNATDEVALMPPYSGG